MTHSDFSLLCNAKEKIERRLLSKLRFVVGLVQLRPLVEYHTAKAIQ